MILTFRQVQILICTLQTTLQVPLKPSQKTLLRDNSLNSNPKNSLSTKIQQINNKCQDKKNYQYCLNILLSNQCYGDTSSNGNDGLENCARTCGRCQERLNIKLYSDVCYDAVHDGFQYGLKAKGLIPINSIEKRKKKDDDKRPASTFCQSVLNSDKNYTDYQLVDDFLMQFAQESYLNQDNDTIQKFYNDLSCNSELGKLACAYTCGNCPVFNRKSKISIDCHFQRNARIKFYRETGILSDGGIPECPLIISDLGDKL